MDLVVEPRLAERREILPRVAVEHQLILNDVEGDVGPQAFHGNAPFRNRRFHRLGRVRIVAVTFVPTLFLVNGHRETPRVESAKQPARRRSRKRVRLERGGSL